MAPWLPKTQWQFITGEDTDDGFSVYCFVAVHDPNGNANPFDIIFGVRRRQPDDKLCGPNHGEPFVWCMSFWKHRTIRAATVPDVAVAVAGYDGWGLIEQLRRIATDPTARDTFFATNTHFDIEEWITKAAVLPRL